MSIISMLLGEKKKSAAIAKERLQIILARECVNGSSAEPDYLPALQKELLAVISALNSLTRPCVIILHTDSQYVKNGITTWIHGWKKNGWKTADKKPVKNADLWLQLDEAQKRHKIDWRWVKGHSGHEFNERADELANRGVEIVLVG